MKKQLYFLKYLKLSYVLILFLGLFFAASKNSLGCSVFILLMAIFIVVAILFLPLCFYFLKLDKLEREGEKEDKRVN